MDGIVGVVNGMVEIDVGLQRLCAVCVGGGMVGFEDVDLVKRGFLGDHYHTAREGDSGGYVQNKAAFGG